MAGVKRLAKTAVNRKTFGSFAKIVCKNCKKVLQFDFNYDTLKMLLMGKMSGRKSTHCF